MADAIAIALRKPELCIQEKWMHDIFDELGDVIEMENHTNRIDMQMFRVMEARVKISDLILQSFDYVRSEMV